jgi:hypothetical protein
MSLNKFSWSSLSPSLATTKKFSNLVTCDEIPPLYNGELTEMSDTCYETAKAFSDIFGNGEKMKSMCREMLSAKKKSYGRTNCNLDAPHPPPIWNQIPHYFPQHLKDTNDPFFALQKCNDSCNTDKYYLGCKENCETDYGAVVFDIIPPLNKETALSQLQNTQNTQNTQNVSSAKTDKNQKTNNVAFYVGLVIFLILLIFFIYMLTKTKKNISKDTFYYKK